MKQKLFYLLIFSPILVTIFFLIQSISPNEIETRSAEQKNTNHLEPERLIFLLQYIAADYDGAVKNREVSNPYEYQEMLEFIETVINGYKAYQQINDHLSHLASLQKLQRSIEKKADFLQVQRQANDLIKVISAELQVVPFPHKMIDLNEGKKLYASACAPCHGLTGDGRGFAADKQKPKPNDFQNPEYMNTLTPYQIFNAVTFGVTGTSMPSYEIACTDAQRWNLAFHVMTLRADFNPAQQIRNPKLTVKDLATQSNADLVDQLSLQVGDLQNAYQLVDYLRLHPPQLSVQEHLQFTQQRLSKSLAAFKKGETEQAVRLTLAAYLEGIEPVEPMLDPAFISQLETQLGSYRHALKTHESVYQIEKRFQAVSNLLNNTPAAGRSSRLQWGFTLIQSLTIVLREGVEAALIIALILTYLTALNFTHLRKYVLAGAIAGVAAGLITWFLSKLFLKISPLQQGALEGLTSLLAALVLFSISFWLIHKVDLERWKKYIKVKAERALVSGSGFALSLVAFVAVYREAFETVLFYQALWQKSLVVQSGLFLGFAVGVLLLTLIIFLIFKIGYKIPLKPFFGVSGVLLAILAFVFTGYGVRELQQIGFLNETLLPWNFNLDLLEIHATMEGILLQMGLLISFMMGWFSIYVQKIRLANQVKLDMAPAK
ncbi:MAG: FTR1 family protein [bacterium]